MANTVDKKVLSHDKIEGNQTYNLDDNITSQEIAAVKDLTENELSRNEELYKTEKASNLINAAGIMSNQSGISLENSPMFACSKEYIPANHKLVKGKSQDIRVKSTGKFRGTAAGFVKVKQAPVLMDKYIN